jgi:hypothetical protein
MNESTDKKCICGGEPSIQNDLGVCGTLIGAGCNQCGVPEVMIAFKTKEEAITHFEQENRIKADFIFDPEGCNNFPNTAYVEVFLGGIGRLCFPDETLQFAENDTYPDIVYSPRLSEDKLEQFCKDNLSKYEAHYEANFDAIDKGDELPPIELFWFI